MLCTEQWRGEKVGQLGRTNEVAVSRVRSPPIRLIAYVDGQVDYHVADAIVLHLPARPLMPGAGGPILPPELRNILLVPAAPHLIGAAHRAGRGAAASRSRPTIRQYSALMAFQLV
jgi:NAD+ kinase